MENTKKISQKSKVESQKTQVENQETNSQETKQATNLKELHALRREEKAVKARITNIMPDAKSEAMILCPEGGKFTIEGVGDFVLDINPVMEKDPEDKEYTGPDILTSTSPEAVAYRKLSKEKKGYLAKASALTSTIKSYYDAFRENNKHRATRFTYTVKCVD